MQHNKSIKFRVCTPADTSDIIDFFWSLKDEFRFKERNAAEAIVPLLFEKGGIIGGYIDDHICDGDSAEKMVCSFGYFVGDPAHGYANQEIGFVYIAGIDKAHRHARVFTNGVHFLATKLQPFGITELRCHAGVDDPYTNRLYGRLGNKIATEPNRSGHLCNLYAYSIQTVLAFANRVSRVTMPQPAELANAS